MSTLFGTPHDATAAINKSNKSIIFQCKGYFVVRASCWVFIYTKPSVFECQLQRDEYHSRSVRSAQTSMANLKCYLYTINNLLRIRNDNELTGIKLKAKFLEQCTNLTVVTQLTNSNWKLENHCTYALVYKLVCNPVNMYVLPVLIII